MTDDHLNRLRWLADPDYAGSLSQESRDAIAAAVVEIEHVEQLQRWTTANPAEPGLYLYRYDASWVRPDAYWVAPVAKEMHADVNGTLYPVRIMPGKWAGPIPLPVETEVAQAGDPGQREDRWLTPNP